MSRARRSFLGRRSGLGDCGTAPWQCEDGLGEGNTGPSGGGGYGGNSGSAGGPDNYGAYGGYYGTPAPTIQAPPTVQAPTYPQNNFGGTPAAPATSEGDMSGDTYGATTNGGSSGGTGGGTNGSNGGTNGQFDSAPMVGSVEQVEVQADATNTQGQTTANPYGGTTDFATTQPPTTSPPTFTTAQGTTQQQQKQPGGGGGGGGGGNSNSKVNNDNRTYIRTINQNGKRVQQKIVNNRIVAQRVLGPAVDNRAPVGAGTVLGGTSFNAGNTLGTGTRAGSGAFTSQGGTTQGQGNTQGQNGQSGAASAGLSTPLLIGGAAVIAAYLYSRKGHAHA